MISEAVGILKNAAANHETINLRIRLAELRNLALVLNVTVDDKFCGGRDASAELNNLWDELIVSWNFRHLFASAKMNSQGG